MRTLFVLLPRQKKKRNDIQWDETTSKKPVVLLLPNGQSCVSSATVVNWGTPSAHKPKCTKADRGNKMISSGTRLPIKRRCFSFCLIDRAAFLYSAAQD